MAKKVIDADEEDEKPRLRAPKAAAIPTEAPADDADTEAEPAPPAPAPVSNPAPVIRESPDDMVKISMYRDFEPAPRVGSYNFVEDGITVLKIHKVYTCPRFVAEHLADRKACTIIQ